jgi:hypothetical protein
MNKMTCLDRTIELLYYIGIMFVLVRYRTFGATERIGPACWDPLLEVYWQQC